MARSAQRRLSAQHPFVPQPPLPCCPYVGWGGSEQGRWDSEGCGGLSAGVLTRLGQLGKCGHSGGRGSWPYGRRWDVTAGRPGARVGYQALRRGEGRGNRGSKRGDQEHSNLGARRASSDPHM